MHGFAASDPLGRGYFFPSANQHGILSGRSHKNLLFVRESPSTHNRHLAYRS
jgi:hypothetical protein